MKAIPSIQKGRPPRTFLGITTALLQTIDNKATHNQWHTKARSSTSEYYNQNAFRWTDQAEGCRGKVEVWTVRKLIDLQATLEVRLYRCQEASQNSFDWRSMPLVRLSRSLRSNGVWWGSSCLLVSCFRSSENAWWGEKCFLIERSQGANGKCFREQPSTIRQSLRVKEAGIHKRDDSSKSHI